MAEKKEQIGLEDISSNLTVGKESRKLYWNDDKVRTEISLSGLQIIIGSLVTVATISAPILFALANLDKIKANISTESTQSTVVCPTVELNEPKKAGTATHTKTKGNSRTSATRKQN